MLPELLLLAGNRSKVRGKQRGELYFPEEKDIMGALLQRKSRDFRDNEARGEPA